MALADPVDHPWHSPTSTAVGEGDARHGEAAAVLDAEDFYRKWVGHLARVYKRPVDTKVNSAAGGEAHSMPHRKK